MKHDTLYANLKEVDEVFEIGINRAVDLLAEKAAKRGGRTAAKALKELGEHPEHGGALAVMDGRYGPYVKWEKVNATLPKETDPQDVTLEQAVALVDEKAAKKGGAKKKAAPKKTAAKKSTAKSGTAKKTSAARKTGTSKSSSTKNAAAKKSANG